MEIVFIGLGVMGNPMAANLVKSGLHQVRVYDIDAARADNLVQLNAKRADSVAQAVSGADLVMTSLPGPKQVDLVAFAEDGLLHRLEPGKAWIDLSTNNLECATAIKSVADQRGVEILDAPVSGGDEGARAGNLTILVGGDIPVFERYRSILEIIGGNITHLGPHGAGYSAKIAQVVLCYLHSLALSEALMLGVKGGVDPAQMLNIIQNSTGKSYVSDRYGPPILAGDYDPSFTVGLAHKDMKLALEMADSLGLKLPFCDLTTQTYARAIDEFGFNANHLKAVRLLEQDNNTYLQINPGENP